MISLPEPNTLTRPYRGLSAQEADIDLRDEAAIAHYILGREVYRRTEWLLLSNGDDRALIEVRKESFDPLFSPVIEARVLALPHRIVWIEDDQTDVGNPTQLALTALRHQRDDADAYAVKGRFEHINVIWKPQPVTVIVTEVVPPEPAKLLELAKLAVGFDEDLPPLNLVLDAVDIRTMAADNPASGYLLPCRGSGVDLPAEVSFLDTRPAERLDWTLIGCERSLQFHRHFYGDEPTQVDFCPNRRSAQLEGDPLVLTKCSETRPSCRGAPTSMRCGSPFASSQGSGHCPSPSRSGPRSHHERPPHRLCGLRTPLGYRRDPGDAQRRGTAARVARPAGRARSGTGRCRTGSARGR